jgi:hypothetical protein
MISLTIVSELSTIDFFNRFCLGVFMFWPNRSKVAANKAKSIRSKINKVEHKEKITDSEGKVTQPGTDYSIHYINDLRAPWFELYDQELYKYLRRELSPELPRNKINYAKYEKAFKDIESAVDDIKGQSLLYLLKNPEFRTEERINKYFENLNLKVIAFWSAIPALSRVLALIFIFLFFIIEVILNVLFFKPLGYIIKKAISFEIEVLNLFTKGEFAKVFDESIYKPKLDGSDQVDEFYKYDDSKSADDLALDIHMENIKSICGRSELNADNYGNIYDE